MKTNMSNRKKSGRNIESIHRLFATGRKKDLWPSRRRQVIDTSLRQRMLKNSLVIQMNPQKRSFYTQEFLHPNKKKISRGKLIHYFQSSQAVDYSKTMVVDLTSNEKDLKPFWTSSCKETSQLLWLPTETDCVDSDSQCLNKSSNSKVQDSWFSIKMVKQDKKSSRMISYPSVPTSQPRPMEEEVIRTRTTELKPSPKQTKIKKNWMGTCRWTYNRCVAFWNRNGDGVQKMYNEKQMTMHLRGIFVTKKSEYLKDFPWVFKTPQPLRDNAMREFIKAKKSKKMKFRSKKDGDCIEVNWRDFIKEELYPATDYGSIKAFEHIDTKYIAGAVRISRNRLNEFHVHIPTKVQCEQKEFEKVIALDPGVRKFLTGYDTNKVLEFCAHEFDYLKKYLFAIDRLVSKISQCKKKKKKRLLNRAKYRLIKKVKNLRIDCHGKICKFLTNFYDVIYLPKFNVQGMLTNLNSKVARNMATMSHFSFRERLKHKCQVTGTQLVICNESYTSQTCTRCGNLEKNNLETYR